MRERRRRETRPPPRERDRDRPTDLALSSPLLVPPFLFKKKLTFFPRLSRRQGFVFFCNPSPPPRRLAGGWSSKNPLLPSSSWTSLNVFFSYGGENFFGLFLAPSRLLFSFFQQCAILCFLSLASKIGLIWRKRWENDAPYLYIYPFPDLSLKEQGDEVYAQVFCYSQHIFLCKMRKTGAIVHKKKPSANFSFDCSISWSNKSHQQSESSLFPIPDPKRHFAQRFPVRKRGYDVALRDRRQSREHDPRMGYLYHFPLVLIPLGKFVYSFLFVSEQF